MLKLKIQYLTIWCEELTHWKKPWCWERLKAGEGDNKSWEGWMSSLSQWTWVWASSCSWWWTGKPGVLQSTGLQRVRHDRVTELNWTDLVIGCTSQMISLLRKHGRQGHQEEGSTTGCGGLWHAVYCGLILWFLWMGLCMGWGIQSTLVSCCDDGAHHHISSLCLTY